MAAIQEHSRITTKGQTTVPKAVRQALGVSYGGEIAFVVDEHGVSVRRVETDEADPVITAFLGFLEQDMLRHPRTVAAFPPDLAGRMEAALGTKLDSYDLIRAEAANGRTFLWYTTELEELENCDRVFVFRHGRIVATLEGGQIGERELIDASFRETA